MSRELERQFVEGAAHAAYVGLKLEDIAPPTPDYAREWAWKLLGALEEINPQWGRSLLSICTAAWRADVANCVENDRRHAIVHGEFDVRAFGSDIAMMALGTGVSWFDDHAHFELHVPDWSADGFELEDA